MLRCLGLGRHRDKKSPVGISGTENPGQGPLPACRSATREARSIRPRLFAADRHPSKWPQAFLISQAASPRPGASACLSVSGSAVSGPPERERLAPLLKPGAPVLGRSAAGKVWWCGGKDPTDFRASASAGMIGGSRSLPALLKGPFAASKEGCLAATSAFVLSVAERGTAV